MSGTLDGGLRCRVAVAALSVVALGLASSAFAGTVAWYRFEEGVGKEFAGGVEAVLDYGPNKLNGTSAGDTGPAYTRAIAPFGEVALRIIGRDDWVFVPDNPKLQLTKSLTLEAFVNIRRFQMNGVANFIIFRGDDRPGLDAYVLSLNPRQETLCFHVDGPGRVRGDPGAVISTPFDRHLAETVHVAGVLNDETGFMGLYVNQELEASMQTRIRPRAALHPIYQPGLGIGGFFAGRAPGSFCIDGSIDEVRISDVALKPRQFLCSLSPVLSWAGTPGFEEDGVEPDSGKPGTRFRFEVRVSAPDGDVPVCVRVRLRRNGAFDRVVDLGPVRHSGDPATGCLYRARVELPAGHWSYQFEAEDHDGRASGEPCEWHEGPTVGKGRGKPE